MYVSNLMEIKIKKEKKSNPLFTTTVSITAGGIIPINVFSVAWLTPQKNAYWEEAQKQNLA